MANHILSVYNSKDWHPAQVSCSKPTWKSNNIRQRPNVPEVTLKRTIHLLSIKKHLQARGKQVTQHVIPFSKPQQQGLGHIPESGTSVKGNSLFNEHHLRKTLEDF